MCVSYLLFASMICLSKEVIQAAALHLLFNSWDPLRNPSRTLDGEVLIENEWLLNISETVLW